MKNWLQKSLAAVLIVFAVGGALPCCKNYRVENHVCVPACCEKHDYVNDKCSPPSISTFEFLPLNDNG